jgi:predicted ester cyclase
MAVPEDTLVRRFYEDLWNRWDDRAVDEVLAVDFEFRGSLGDVTHGRAQWRTYRDGIRRAVPDFHNEIVELVTSSGRAAARLVYTGHHHGVLLDRRGHGAPIRYEGAAFFRCASGRLTAAWVLGDVDGLRRQLDGGGPNPEALIDTEDP